jgi:hypothetical protein
MSGEFIDPPQRAKIYFVLGLSVAGTIAGAGFLEFWFKPWLATATPCDAIATLRPLLMSLACLLMAVGVWAALLAFKVLKLKQWPLPGAWVAQRTSVQRGWPVTFRGYVALLLSATLIGLPVWNWQSTDKLVTALTQKGKCVSPGN